MNKPFKMLLIDRELSQVELAHRIGTSEAQLSRWVHGYALPGEFNLERLAKELDIGVMELADMFVEKS